MKYAIYKAGDNSDTIAVGPLDTKEALPNTHIYNGVVWNFTHSYSFATDKQEKDLAILFGKINATIHSFTDFYP